MAISTTTRAGWWISARARLRWQTRQRARTDKRAQRQAAAALRQQLAPHKREAEKLEKDLGKLHEQLAKVETRLGDTALYEAARKDELRDLLAEQARLKAREAELEEAWLLALESLEELQRQLEAAD
jgi:ATP-binding cassette subfamily F protein 3